MQKFCYRDDLEKGEYEWPHLEKVKNSFRIQSR
jgi:hypothetical protein